MNTLKYHFIIIVTIIIVVLDACESGKPSMPTQGLQPYEDDYCIALPYDANIYQYRYENDRDSIHILQAMSLLDSALIYCNCNKNVIVDKICFLYLLGQKYQEGIDFIKRIDSTVFYPQYNRNFYLKTYESIIFNNNGDFENRDRMNREISSEIEQYIIDRYSDNFYKNTIFSVNVRNNISQIIENDYEALSLYYRVKGRYENIYNLIEEIKGYNRENEFDKKLLEEIIYILEEMNKKDIYHIEYNIK